MTSSNARPIDVYTFGSAWGLPVPTSSPFGIKLVTWLRMHDVPYRVHVENNPGKGPKGKCPWVVIDGETIGDSELVIERLRARHDLAEDAGLSPRQRATATATRLMLEEHFHQIWEHEVFIYEPGWELGRTFFDQLPPGVRVLMRTLVRRGLRQQLHARGVGRHSHEQIVKLGVVALDALDELLGDGPFFFGEQPTDIDATVFGFLAVTHWPRIRSPVWDHFRARPRLGQYCERTLERYYSAVP